MAETTSTSNSKAENVEAASAQAKTFEASPAKTEPAPAAEEAPVKDANSGKKTPAVAKKPVAKLSLIHISEPTRPY